MNPKARRLIGPAIIGVGLLVVIVGTVWAQASTTAVVEAIPPWLTGGMGLSVIGMLVNYGRHKEFKITATNDIKDLKEDMKDRVTHQGLESAIEGTHQRLDDLRELVLSIGAERRQQPRGSSRETQ